MRRRLQLLSAVRLADVPGQVGTVCSGGKRVKPNLCSDVRARTVERFYPWRGWSCPEACRADVQQTITRGRSTRLSVNTAQDRTGNIQDGRDRRVDKGMIGPVHSRHMVLCRSDLTSTSISRNDLGRSAGVSLPHHRWQHTLFFYWSNEL